MEGSQKPTTVGPWMKSISAAVLIPAVTFGALAIGVIGPCIKASVDTAMASQRVATIDRGNLNEGYPFRSAPITIDVTTGIRIGACQWLKLTAVPGIDGNSMEIVAEGDEGLRVPGGVKIWYTSAQKSKKTIRWFVAITDSGGQQGRLFIESAMRVEGSLLEGQFSEYILQAGTLEEVASSYY